MAVSYKEVKQAYTKKMHSDLTTEELNEVELVENKIDAKIKESFNDSSIRFDINIVVFNKHHHIRASLMRKELERRYKKSGWAIEVYSEEDGPNFPGITFWVLSGRG